MDRVRVYPRVKGYTRALPITKWVGYGYYPWVEKYAHTLPMRVQYPRVSVSVGKIAILNPEAWENIPKQTDFWGPPPWRPRAMYHPFR
jgi:hypothetical protein